MRQRIRVLGQPDKLGRGCYPAATCIVKDLEHGMAEVDGTRFSVGTGIHDITGPAAEREMMGYVMMTPPQETAGIHMRLRARAFVVCSPATVSAASSLAATLAWCFRP